MDRRWIGIVLCLLPLSVATFAPVQGTEGEQLVADGIELAQRGDHSGAVDHFDRAIKMMPDSAEPYYWRGRSLFCLAKPKQAVADFDHYVKLKPSAANSQWERGIALYYAGEYAAGAEQFALYQTYHDNDVENSAWRYLCVARDKSVAEAEKTMLPIKNDTRVPMMQIYDLYRGQATPDDVLAAAEKDKDKINDKQLEARRFYAHLYIGLWYEAAGKKDLARKHVTEAGKHRLAHYMYDVARVHNELRGEK